MKNAFRNLYLSIAIFALKFIMPILDIIDALYAKRKYRSLFKYTDRMYAQYIYTRNLFFLDGGPAVNKERIISRAKVLKQNAEIVEEALTKLNTEWEGFFGETAKDVMRTELEILEEIRKFGESCSQKKST